MSQMMRMRGGWWVWERWGTEGNRKKGKTYRPTVMPPNKEIEQCSTKSTEKKNKRQSNKKDMRFKQHGRECCTKEDEKKGDLVINGRARRERERRRRWWERAWMKREKKEKEQGRAREAKKKEEGEKMCSAYHCMRESGIQVPIPWKDNLTTSGLRQVRTAKKSARFQCICQAFVIKTSSMISVVVKERWCKENLQ